MPLSAFALILLAGVIHASWNIAAKKANGDARFAFQSGVLMMVVWAPVGIALGWRVVPHWGPKEWGFIVLSGALHVVYYVTLLRGYRKSDLTVVYPLARGSGPLLSPLVAILFLGERISLIGLAGIFGVVLGVFLVAGGPGCGADHRTPCSASVCTRAFATASSPVPSSRGTPSSTAMR